jgi:hypothetical protein
LFERYTEHARRSIFFARYEASIFGSPQITSEELLLGILREEKTLAMELGADAAVAIRKEIEALEPKRQRVSTSVDLPLSHESKRALAYAAEECERLNQEQIGTPHLMLGLLREENSLAAKLLRKHGMTLEKCREIARKSSPERTVRRRSVVFERPEPAPVAPLATSLESSIYDLRQLVNNTAARLRGYDESYGGQELRRKLQTNQPQTGQTWTRKEALGHLIDYAIVHQQWVTGALLESKLQAAGYPDAAAVIAQRYAEFPWQETVDLWVSLNRLLIHVLVRVPEDKLSVPCRIGSAEPVPLSKLLDAYIEHCEDIVAQILERLD